MHYISSSGLLGSSQLWQFLTVSLFFMTLTAMKSTGQVLCRTAIGLGLPDVLLIFTRGLWVSGIKTIECHSHHIISRVHAITMNNHCWCWPDYLGWGSAYQVSPFQRYSSPSFPCYSLEGSHCSQPTLKGWRPRFPSLRKEYLHKQFGILLHNKFISSPIFMYLINY